MHAWQIVKSLDTAFAEPLVLKSLGGKAKGGTTRSETGREVRCLYHDMESSSQSACEKPGPHRHSSQVLTPRPGAPLIQARATFMVLLLYSFKYNA